ncbi:hypothetical protein Prudu_013447, partial [Prunus dulcis]
ILYPSLFSPSLSLSSLSLPRVAQQCDRSPSKRRLGHHRPSRSPPWVPTGPPPCPSQPDQPPPGAALSWPENRVFRRRFVRSYPNFQLEILLRFSTKSIEHQEPDRIEKGPSRVEAVDVRGIHHRATHNLRASSQVKSFGNGQNTGETLPNFRQKSKGILKKS